MADGGVKGFIGEFVAEAAQQVGAKPQAQAPVVKPTQNAHQVLQAIAQAQMARTHQEKTYREASAAKPVAPKAATDLFRPAASPGKTQTPFEILQKRPETKGNRSGE